MQASEFHLHSIKVNMGLRKLEYKGGRVALFQSAWAAITVTEVGWHKQATLISHSSGGWGVQDHVSGESPLPGLETAMFLLRHYSMKCTERESTLSGLSLSGH